MDNANHCLCHKPLEVSRTRLHQHSGGTGSAPASYLPQLAGGCVALAGVPRVAPGNPRYIYIPGGGGITGTASGHQWPLIHFCPFFLCVCVHVRVRACVSVCVCVSVRLSLIIVTCSITSQILCMGI